MLPPLHACLLAVGVYQDDKRLSQTGGGRIADVLTGFPLGPFAAEHDVHMFITDHLSLAAPAGSPDKRADPRANRVPIPRHADPRNSQALLALLRQFSH